MMQFLRVERVSHKMLMYTLFVALALLYINESYLVLLANWGIPVTNASVSQIIDSSGVRLFSNYYCLYSSFDESSL